ncbi:MAG: LuxR C-terminal-related transcriptional regulator [Frankiaceae bacterium]
MSALRTWGLDEVDELVYRAALRHPGRTRDELAGLIGRTYVEVLTSGRRLARLGLVEVRGSCLVGRSPVGAFAELLTAARGELVAKERQLMALREELPMLIGDYGEGEQSTDAAAPMEIVAGAEAVNAVLADLSGHATGELLTCIRPPMRPPGPGSPEGDRSFSLPDFVTGRTSRTIYRADLLEHREWWRAVREIAAGGAHVRVATDVPTKLVVVPGRAAMIPLDFDTQDSNNGLLVREPTLVGVLAELFELVWERAMPFSALDPPAERPGQGAGHDVLALLATGSKDEKIARQLDLSLRTVRRHVASLLEDLGARTRFQAGVQAVRRGWL